MTLLLLYINWKSARSMLLINTWRLCTNYLVLHITVGGRQGRVPEPTYFEKSERG